MTLTQVVETPAPADVPASGRDQNLLRRFREHVEGERERVEAYAQLVGSGPEDVCYLVQLIFEDGARNRRLFVDMINQIRSDIDSRDYEPRLPDRGGISTGRDRLLGATQRLIDLELEDEAALEGLHQELGPTRGNTLFSLLLELMEVDARKHIRILESIRSQFG